MKLTALGASDGARQLIPVFGGHSMEMGWVERISPRTHRGVAWSIVCGASVGAWLGYSALHGPRYTISTPFAFAWCLALILGAMSAVLFPFERTRSAAWASVACAVAILLFLYLVFIVGYRLGFHNWWGDKLMPI
jgi:hypothetical protein